MDKRCRCLGGLAVEVGAGGGRLPSLCLPIPPLPGGPKSPPSRTKGRGGGNTATIKHVTRRQMSPPPSAAACEVGGGELCGREGLGRHHAGRTLSRCGAGTPTPATGSLWGQSRGGHHGAEGCMWAPWNARGKQRLALGWGWGKAGGQTSPGGHGHPYSLSTPMAVPLVARGRPQLPARVGEGCSQQSLGKGGCEPPHPMWDAQPG